eukprot:TRINITY_DN3464_c1_g3_i1.p1 TRINITY_DN3464_c1_g3~~TRINITY_DN3464_c1_g3_i1.p1  ORF type:complete len:1396 (-),score=468.31 TRINITY_DN3464_c1_g3_i1:254-3868(-)
MTTEVSTTTGTKNTSEDGRTMIIIFETNAVSFGKGFVGTYKQVLAPVDVQFSVPEDNDIWFCEQQPIYISWVEHWDDETVNLYLLSELGVVLDTIAEGVVDHGFYLYTPSCDIMDALDTMDVRVQIEQVGHPQITGISPHASMKKTSGGKIVSNIVYNTNGELVEGFVGSHDRDETNDYENNVERNWFIRIPQSQVDADSTLRFFVYFEWLELAQVEDTSGTSRLLRGRNDVDDRNLASSSSSSSSSGETPMVCDDWVIIWNSATDTVPVFKGCLKDEFTPFFSSGTELKIDFETNASRVTDVGFGLRVEVIPQNCVGERTIVIGEELRPHYITDGPLNVAYAPNRDCKWIVKMSDEFLEREPPRQLALSLERLFLADDNSGSCADHMIVKDSDGDEIAKWCGDDDWMPVVGGEQATIEFYSDALISQDGFLMEVMIQPMKSEIEIIAPKRGKRVACGEPTPLEWTPMAGGTPFDIEVAMKNTELSVLSSLDYPHVAKIVSDLSLSEESPPTVQWTPSCDLLKVDYDEGTGYILQLANGSKSTIAHHVVVYHPPTVTVFNIPHIVLTTSGMTVKWSSMGSVSIVSIFVMYDGKVVDTIAENLPSSGSYRWTPDVGLMTTDVVGYTIKVVDVDSSAVISESDMFRIDTIEPSITFVSPSGDSFDCDTPIDIGWRSTGSVGQVHLLFKQGGKVLYDIGNILNSGSHSWNPSAACEDQTITELIGRIHIFDAYDDQLEAFSGLMSIVPHDNSESVDIDGSSSMAETIIIVLVVVAFVSLCCCCLCNRMRKRKERQTLEKRIEEQEFVRRQKIETRKKMIETRKKMKERQEAIARGEIVPEEVNVVIVTEEPSKNNPEKASKESTPEFIDDVDGENAAPLFDDDLDDEKYKRKPDPNEVGGNYKKKEVKAKKKKKKENSDDEDTESTNEGQKKYSILDRIQLKLIQKLGKEEDERSPSPEDIEYRPGRANLQPQQNVPTEPVVNVTVIQDENDRDRRHKRSRSSRPDTTTTQPKETLHEDENTTPHRRRRRGKGNETSDDKPSRRAKSRHRRRREDTNELETQETTTTTITSNPIQDEGTNRRMRRARSRYRNDDGEDIAPSPTAGNNENGAHERRRRARSTLRGEDQRDAPPAGGGRERRRRRQEEDEESVVTSRSRRTRRDAPSETIEPEDVNSRRSRRRARRENQEDRSPVIRTEGRRSRRHGRV